MVYVPENFQERWEEYNQLNSSKKLEQYELMLGSHVTPSLIWTDKVRMLAMIDWMLENEFPYIAAWWTIQLPDCFPEDKQP